jgi:PAS domain S-box-containing protein
VPILISHNQIKYVCYTSSDITDRKISEEKIKNSENLYNSTINSFNDLLFVVDKNLCILLANEALVRFNIQNNYDKEISGKNLLNVFPFFNQNIKEQFSEVFNTGKEIVNEENLILTDRSVFVEFKMTPIFQNDKVERVVTVMRDITERKNFEKRIMNAIIETEERERKRFSEDLHDEMGSLLSTIKIYINTLYKEELPLERREHLIELTNQLINQAIESSKDIANNLSPNIIMRFGLISAIQSLCEKIRSTTELTITFHSDSYTHTLKADEEISIFRIVSELINNTLKHADAKNIEIVFSSSGNNLIIEYSDDGRGFDFEKMLTLHTKGMGLQNIKSRIQSLGGTLQVETGKKGFAIRIDCTIS